MAEIERKNWRELCNAAREANDPDELLKILRELNKALRREEQVRRDFRELRNRASLPAKADLTRIVEAITQSDF
jgi:hypothetical protein